MSAQDRFSVSGEILDQDMNPLIAANVYIMETLSGATSNLSGNYTISGVLPGEYHLLVSVIGYKKDTLAIQVVRNNIIVSFQLEVEPINLGMAEVVADRVSERTSTSNVAFTSQALETNQGLTQDPLRTLASLPGIGREGDLFSPSQIYVRGGAPDENLFLMDNNKVYFPYYFGGQKSIFNTDAIESLELLTGGFSAAYGNHMSSVMNVQTRDGDFEHYKGGFSFGFYNSSANFEGPILKNKVSVLIAARRTYLDLFLDETAEIPVPSLGDITYKVSYRINDANKLTFSGLSSSELMDFTASKQEPGLPNKIEIAGKNHYQSIQLRSSSGSKIYNKLALTNTLNKNQSEVGANLFLNINAWQAGLRDDFTYYISNRHKIKTGIEYQFGSFDYSGNSPLDPLKTDPNDTTVVLQTIEISQKGEAIKSAYILYDGSPIGRIGINAGVRLDNNKGNGYTDISPRFAINYQLSNKSKIRFSTGIYTQFPGSETGNQLKSSKAIHYILGYEYRFSNDLYAWVEGYYKDYSDLVYYDENLNYSNLGKGAARGLEFFVRKEAGNFQGWVSYALSRSERLIPLLNEIKDFEYDQRHIFNLVAVYQVKVPDKMWFIPALFQINFRYSDGRPYSPVTGAVNPGTGWMPIYGEPLSLRNPDYKNLNIKVEWRMPRRENFGLKTFIEVWNLLNAKNVLGRTYQYGTAYPNNVNVQPYYTTPFLFSGGFKIEIGKM